MMKIIDKLLDNKLHPAAIGFLQTLAVVVYSAKVAAFIFFMGESKVQPGYFGIVLMLVLLVFSAGITGTFVFGLPVYYALKNNVKRAIEILVFTFFYFLIAIILTVLFIFSIA